MPVKKIDIHTHIVPPFWKEAVDAAHKIPSPPLWDEEKHIEFMKRCDISKSILHVTSPGSHLVPGQDQPARDLARRCNEFAAEVKKRRPDRFSYWANLPLPDVEGSVAEIKYAFENLNPDGVAVLTNHHGIYFGDLHFEPVYAELNRRKATVFIHPTVPTMQHGDGILPAMPLKDLSQGIAEYMFEETRVILNLLRKRIPIKYPDITFIIPHGGGAFPPVIERFSCFGTWVFGGIEDLSSDEIKQVMSKHFYFDLTGFPFPDQIHGLLRFVDSSRLLFGTDYPYLRADSSIRLSDKMDHESPKLFDEAAQEAIYRGNAEKLLAKTSPGPQDSS